MSRVALPAAHRAVDVHEASQVGEARRAAAQLAEEAGLDGTAAGRVALVATELGTNLVRHAQRGRLLLAPVRMADGRPGIEILSMDHGPGIADVQACLRDGYSTAGTPGNGLGAVRRMSDEFDLYAAPPAGTVILARIAAEAPRQTAPAAPAPAIWAGGVALAAPGETACGDAWAVMADGDRASVLVADGLGHGPIAAEAAQAAAEVFHARPWDAPCSLLERQHERLRSTRGAAVLVATLDRAQDRITVCGAGNIAGRVISGVEDRSVLSQHGTVGMQIRRPQQTTLDWPSHALLVLHSDGVTARWKLDNAPGLLQHHPTVVAAWLLRDHARGRDDATVVVLKRRGPR